MGTLEYIGRFPVRVTDITIDLAGRGAPTDVGQAESLRVGT